MGKSFSLPSRSMSRFSLTIITFLSCLLCNPTGIKGQNVNPFEIKSRLDSVRQLPQASIIEQDTLLPFKDTLRGESSLDTVQLKEVNPFDVDHLPMRKNLSASKKSHNSGAEFQDNVSSDNFLFWLLLLASALLAVVLNLNFTFIKLLFRSLLNFNLFKLFHREEGGRLSVSQIIFYLIYFICGATIIYLFLHQDTAGGGLIEWSYICFGLAGFYIIKHVMLIFLGFIFEIEKSTSLYNFSIIAYHSVVAILLLPLCYIAAFATESISIPVLYLALFILLSSLLIKAIRGLFISMEYWSDRLFQFFMYLCGFEILPVLVLVKFLMYQVNL